MTDRRSRRSLCGRLVLGGALALPACSSASHVADADREVGAVLDDAQQRALGDREERLLRPTIEAKPPATPTVPTAPGEALAPGPIPAAAPPAPPPQKFDLATALATAVRQNREFLTRREGLYQQGLSYTLTRFEFGPQFAAAVNYLWPRNEDGTGSQNAGASLSVSQVLPTGGSLALSTGLDAQWPFGPGSSDPSYGSSANVTLTQPLLRGAGPSIVYEPLTQAERSLVYAIRDFELFRQSFTIRIAQQFFELTSRRQTLGNQDRNYESAVFDRKKAEALQQVGRNDEQEVFRARRREIEAKDQLIEAVAAYDRAVDDFKIVLGLPTSVAIELSDVEPPYEPVRFEVTSAIAAARHNRLDLLTERQRLEDTERQLRIVENALLPGLDLTASFGAGGAGNDLGHAPPDEWNSSVGVSFEIPLQRKAQRNSYRSALIGLEQARRGLQLLEDQLDQDIRDAVRRLRSVEERIVLQEEQILQEQRAVTVTEIRYEAGDVDNRELLEARQALVNARNALIRLKVEHFIARLNLLKDMGIFFVDEKGIWR